MVTAIMLIISAFLVLVGILADLGILIALVSAVLYSPIYIIKLVSRRKHD